MSSLPNSATQPSQTGGVPRAGRLTTEDVRRTLHQHLKKTASFIKFMDALVLVSLWLAGILLLWLVACVVDHWLLPLPRWGRWLFWCLGVAGTARLLVWRLLPLIVGRINPTYAAKRIEHLVPEFKNGLISWLELESMPGHGVPRGVMSALTHRAARFIVGQDPSSTVDTSPLIKMIGTVLLLTTGLVLYTMVSPKSVLDSGKRILMPWSSVTSPTRVHILKVSPGDIELTQGKPLSVEVEIKGLRQNETVEVRYSTLDGQLLDQRTKLTEATGVFRYTGNVVTSSQGIEQPLEYWIEAGDAQSGPYRVRISPLPSVVLQTIELQYPAYTQLEKRVVSGDKIEAVEGTRATLRAQANQPLKRGRLEINPTVDEAGELVRAESFVDMQVQDRQLAGEVRMLLSPEKTNPTKMDVRIRGYNLRGDSNPRPITHTLSVLADVAPEVNLLGPANRIIRVHPDSRLNLEVRASDPDFGLTRIDLKISRNSLPSPDVTLLESEGVRGRQIKTWRLDLTQWRASVGDVFQIRAVASDNRHDPISQQAQPNVSESQPLILHVVAAQASVDVKDEPMSNPADAAPTSDAPKQPEDPQSRNGEAASNSAANPKESAPPNKASNPSESSSGGQKESEQNPKPDSPSESESSQSQAGGSGKSSEGASDSSQQQNGTGGQSSSSDSSNSSQKSDASSQGSNQSNQGNPSQQGSESRSKNGPGSGHDPKSSDAGSSGSNTDSPDGASKSDSNERGGKPLNDGETFERVREYLGQMDEKTASGKPGDQRPQKSNDQPKGNSSGEGSANPTGSDQTNSQSPENSAPGKQPESNSASPSSASTSKSNPDQSPDNASRPSNSTKGSEPPPGTQPQSSQRSSSSNPEQQAGQAQNSAQQNSPSPEQQAAQPNSQQQGTEPSGANPPSSQQQDATQKNPGKQNSQQPGSQSTGSQPTGSNQNSQQGSAQQNQGQQDSPSQGSPPQGSEQPGAQQAGSNQQGGQQPGTAQPSQEPQAAQSRDSQPSGSQEPGPPQGSQQQGSQQQGSQQQGSQQQGSQQQGSQQQGSQQQGSPQQVSPQQGTEQKNSQPEGSQQQSGEQGSQQQGSQQQGSQSGSQSRGNSGQAGGKDPGGGTGTQGGEGGATGAREETNREFAEKTTQLVLDYLNRQKDQPDPELLRELDWQTEDLRRFADRWNKARDLSNSADPADRIKWEEMLEELKLTPPNPNARQGSARNDAFQQMQDSGGRLRMPESLRKQYEAYQRAMERAR